jgi:DNA polymerase-3 subunit delta'
MSFKDIKGQSRPIEILKSYLNQSQLSGGYLFTGPEGVGKKLTAKALAKAVNCLEGELDACDKCVSCQKIERNDHPDVHIIDSGNEEIKIEDIRQLQKDMSFRAYEGRVKVFIIDNAHKLNAESANCLLKILEEPPKESLIILVSDKPALLFKTIISRCKTVKFSSMPRNELEGFLRDAYGLESTDAHFLAYFSEGRLGTAMRLKETEAIREKNAIIDKIALTGSSGIEQLGLQKREELKRCLNILATWFRDIYLVKIGMPHQELINYDRKDELLRSMSKFTFADLNEILASISDSILYLDQNINTKLVMHNMSLTVGGR